MDEVQISPDGKWKWTGSEWTPNIINQSSNNNSEVPITEVTPKIEIPQSIQDSLDYLERYTSFTSLMVRTIPKPSEKGLLAYVPIGVIFILMLIFNAEFTTYFPLLALQFFMILLISMMIAALIHIRYSKGKLRKEFEIKNWKKEFENVTNSYQLVVEYSNSTENWDLSASLLNIQNELERVGRSKQYNDPDLTLTSVISSTAGIMVGLTNVANAGAQGQSLPSALSGAVKQGNNNNFQQTQFGNGQQVQGLVQPCQKCNRKVTILYRFNKCGRILCQNCSGFTCQHCIAGCTGSLIQ